MHEGRNVVPDVHAVLDKMADLTYRLRGGDWKDHTGKRIRTSCMNSPYRLARRVEDEDNEQQG